MNSYSSKWINIRETGPLSSSSLSISERIEGHNCHVTEKKVDRNLNAYSTGDFSVFDNQKPRNNLEYDLNKTRPNNEIKYYDVSRGETRKYFYINTQRLVMFKVSKKEFKERSGIFLSKNNSKYKVDGATKQEAKALINKVQPFVGESLFSSLSNFRTGLSSAISMISLLGKTVNVGKEKSRDIKLFLASCLSILLKFFSFDFQRNIVTQLIEACIELYRAFCIGESIKDAWKAQVLDSMILSTASLFLPKCLFEILKRMTLFTSAKLCDDAGGIFHVFMLICEFLSSLLNYIPFSLPSSIKNLFSFLSFNHYTIIFQCDNLVKEWLKNKKKVSESSFRDRVFNLQNRVINNIELTEWVRRSPTIKAKLVCFDRLVKSCDAFSKSDRIEPSCFIFEGPPGVFKSVFMSKLIKALNMSSYSHVTKSATDGKDFFDTYNNEEVFFMDDVGQQGVSQWRNIINIVSPVKLPLDCAAAELKDTKFFTSEVVLLTTNRFKNLGGLTKQDGIDNIQALWRRAIVFDFSRVIRDGSKLSGTINIARFDVNAGVWVNDFDDDTQLTFASNGYFLEPFIDVSANHNVILAWMKLIVTNVRESKRSHYFNNDLTQEDLEGIDLLTKTFKTVDFDGQSLFEGISDTAWFIVDGVKWTMECFDMFLTSTKEFVLSFFQDFDFSEFCNGVQNAFWTTLPVFVIAAFIIFGLEIGSYYRERNVNNSWKMESSVKEKIISALVTDKSNIDSLVALLQKQIFDIELVIDGKTLRAIGLFSGRSMVTVGHIGFADRAFVNAYKDLSKAHRILDNITVNLVYRSQTSDISVWHLPQNFPSPFKDISHAFKGDVVNGVSYLLHPMGIIDLGCLPAAAVEIPTPYDITFSGKTFENMLSPSDYFYALNYPGMCGAPIVTTRGTICGIHVAGSSSLGIGTSIKLPRSVLDDIIKHLNPISMKINITQSEKVIPNFSGIKIDQDFKIYTPKNSDYIRSPLYDVFPISRVPSNLSADGPHTVKTVAKKSFALVQPVSFDELDFAKKIVSTILPVSWDDIDMKEVIQGTNLLAAINKKSSNGYDCIKDKSDCIDFEKGCLTDKFKPQYEEFLNKVNNREFEASDVLWYESLKDEVRSKDKVLPRSFRVSRLHMQLLTKKVFGKMVEHIVANRGQNEIMVGVNPFTEWNSIYKRVNCERKWAGDIKSWDGSMLPQVQNAIYEVLRKKYKGNVNELDCILGFLNYCVVAVNDDTYMTTHSLPSGSFLTAIYNSLVNRAYTAMWYYRYMKLNNRKPTVSGFCDLIVDFVYGDDKLNAIKKEGFDFLNAVTMQEFFVSIGMDFTDSKKGKIESSYQNFDQITFLKRSFVYHKQLNDIVGPLDTDTLYSSLSWVNKNKDITQVMNDKISAFQREIYLHESLYDNDILILERRCLNSGIDFKKLNSSYLFQLYKLGDYFYLDSLYGINTS